MKSIKIVALLLASAGLVSACTSLDLDAVQVENVTIKSEETLTTGIESVRLWKRENGNALLTGRIVQRGYGRLISGHIDIQFFPRSGESVRQYIADLRPGRKITKTRKVGYFDTDLGALDVAGGTAVLKYHDSAHDGPLKLLKAG